MANEEKKSIWRIFWDFFVLFFGISTAANLSRTQGREIRSRGLFLIRKPRSKPDDDSPPSD